jgi:hypothetical protein
MQISQKLLKTGGLLLRLAILAACVWYIMTAVADRWVWEYPGLERLVPALMMCVVLMPLNWYLEALRWKISLGAVRPCTMGEAWRQVLSGLALNWVLPFTAGDLVARLLPNTDRKLVIYLLMWNRSVMLILTLLFGMYGLHQWGNPVLAVRGVLAIVLLMVLVAVVMIVRRLLVSKPFHRHWVPQLVGLSVVRYAIFTWQFYVLLWAFLPDVPWQIVLGGVAWVFLFRSVVPSLFGNFGVREASAMLFFEGVVDNPTLVLVPSLLIWVVNTVLASVVGLFFILKPAEKG